LDTYSLENARKFQWSSVTGNLNVERVSYLNRFLMGDRILDAGCAGGAYSEYLRSKGFDVIGVDKTLEFLEVIPDNHRHFYKQADILNLPFEDGYFDCTYCFDVLEHVDDLSALKELIRVTKRRVIVTVPHENHGILQSSSLTLSTYQDCTHLRYYNPDSLRQLIQTVITTNCEIFGEVRVPVHHLCSQLIKGKSKQYNPAFILRNTTAFLVKVLLYFTSELDLPLYSSLVAIIDLQSST
jgi:SAM-dependent methyltransferase